MHLARFGNGAVVQQLLTSYEAVARSTVVVLQEAVL